MAKENIQYSDLLNWDEYINKSAEEALKEIYSHAGTVSQRARTWYWRSIKTKKFSSLSIRFMTFLLLVCGAVLPILAGLFSLPDIRLQLTQIGVTSLAVAGLLQIADRIFGWSTGWLRYITTVMAMEDLTRKFELDWTNYMIVKTGSIADIDKKPLFDLAKQFEDDISKKQNEETEKWVTEFNNSTALLSELIKSQRESAEKSYADEKDKQKAQQPGAIKLTVKYQAAPLAIKIAIDNGNEESFIGTNWSKLGLSPGLHEVCVSTIAQPQITKKIPIIVPAAGIAELEVSIP